MESQKKLKILWAVDALDPFPEVMEKISSTLKEFQKKMKTEIQPVFVLSPEQLGLNTDLGGPISENPFREGAQRALDQCMERFQFLNPLKPEVIVQHKRSLKASVQKLIEYANFHAVDFIITGTQGKKGLERMMIGSFAEDLMLHSKLPVLVVGANAQECSTFDRFLIPNDLSHPKSEFFKNAFEFSKKMDVKVTVLNAIPRPVDAIIQSGAYLFAGAWVSLSLFSQNEISKQEAKISEVKKFGNSLNVPCDTVVDHQCLGIRESIFDHAKKEKVSMIVMEAHSGPLASAFLGSITRKVIRDAPCPVWIMRTSG